MTEMLLNIIIIEWVSLNFKYLIILQVYIYVAWQVLAICDREKIWDYTVYVYMW